VAIETGTKVGCDRVPYCT